MKLSFQSKLLISMLLLLLVSLLALSSLAHRLLNTEVTQAVQSEINNTLRNVETFAAGWLNAKSDLVVSLTQQIPAQRSDAEHFLTYAREAGQFDLVYVGTAQGEMWQSRPAANLPSDYDPRTRPWYQQASSRNSLVVTPPYADAGTGEMIISLAAPLRNGSRGVIGSDISIDSVIRELLSIESRWTSELWMLDGNQTVIAHPDTGRIQQNVRQFLPDLTIPRQQNVVEIRYNNEVWLMSATHIAEADWTFLLLVKRSEAMEAISQLTWTLLTLSLLVLVLSGGILYLLVNYQTRPLKELALALEDVSQGEGDLTHRLKVETADEFGQMSLAFNRFVAQLQTTISEMILLTDQVNQAAGRSVEDVHNSLEQLTRQKEELTQLAAAAQEMSSATGEIARNAEQTADIAQQSSESTQAGLRVVKTNREQTLALTQRISDSTAAINTVDQHVQRITGILDNIQSIAEQTNLLALNAAIEAARAGDQGRGFAVVADEVRTLSQRSHQATEDIRAMIAELQDSTRDAVNLMGQSQEQARINVESAEKAEQQLMTIDQASGTISGMAIQIASAVEEQNAVTTEISSNTEQIKVLADNLTDQTSDAGNRANQLKQVANALHQLSDRFKV
ncbi:Methyl-accepting chemotaxis protein [Nitrincola lacisaponensis]|uniref:Methyl-accepting chemotaxis protein n=1 Tax=Nitrincola lacisaponensis TaxID=267850 RepID=A0A063XWN9_9GAMM|nr:methyl-accepting chemotaxis protein [Nitrincola lacisaponensis]KDE38623.1 Methyl-accepting chemotaxis protein [Nitrincola lacisaponensis]